MSLSVSPQRRRRRRRRQAARYPRWPARLVDPVARRPPRRSKRRLDRVGLPKSSEKCKPPRHAGLPRRPGAHPTDSKRGGRCKSTRGPSVGRRGNDPQQPRVVAAHRLCRRLRAGAARTKIDWVDCSHGIKKFSSNWTTWTTSTARSSRSQPVKKARRSGELEVCSVAFAQVSRAINSASLASADAALPRLARLCALVLSKVFIPDIPPRSKKGGSKYAKDGLSCTNNK